MDITMTAMQNGVAVAIPFTAEKARAELKALGGRWDPDGKRWVLSAAMADAAGAVLVDHFGGFNARRQGGARVTLRATRDVSRVCGSICGLGRELVIATGRDSGARPGAGVAILDGRATSGGSARYWETRVTGGTKLVVEDVDLDRVRDAAGNIRVPDGFEVVEVVEPETDGLSAALQAALQAYRQLSPEDRAAFIRMIEEA